MAKNNPNRQQLLEFINSFDKDFTKIDKIQDLASGVHYLYLLHKVHPNVVKIGKVNTKAFLQHQNVNNLKLLAHYLSEVKAPFTFEVPKTAARNYQQNLNLLKNLYKYYHSSQSKEVSLSKESKSHPKQKNQHKKIQPKIVIKPPQKINKPLPLKKYSPDNSGIKGIVNDSKTCMEQIKKILVVVQEEKTHEQEAAQQKLKKIKKILGIQTPYSQKKQKKVHEQTNYSIKCTASKSNFKNSNQFEEETTDDLKLKSQNKLKSFVKNQDGNGQNKTDANKNIKAFDCQEIKQSVISKFNGRSTRKSINSRRLTGQIQKQLLGTDQEDEKYNQYLLSPSTGNKNGSKRKSVSRRNQDLNQLSKGKNQSNPQLKDPPKSAKIQPSSNIKQIKQSDNVEKENNKIQNQ